MIASSVGWEGIIHAAITGLYSSCQLRAVGWRGQLNSNLIENAVVRMIGNGAEKHEKERNTHHCCLLHVNHQWGWWGWDLIPLVD
jgi:hypothetical protein